jgi:hypothetical protein
LPLPIYLITQENNGISALELSRQLDVSYNTAWRIKQKRSFVAAVSMNDDGNPMWVHFSVVNGFKKAELTRWAKVHLRPISFVILNGSTP